MEDFCWAVSTLEYLRARRFDVVLFNECGGQGYFALLAKRAGVFPEAPRMIVVTHGASDWARELNAQLPANYRSAGLAFFERRSVELADLVVSPSRYLVRMDARSRLVGCRRHTRRCKTSFPPPPKTCAPAPSKIDEIVFFGRLELRKGIEIFLMRSPNSTAPGELEPDRRDLPRASSRALAASIPASSSLSASKAGASRRASWPICGQEQALDYLKRPGVLARHAVAGGESPCVVAECLIAGVPFLATESGGTAELVAEPTAATALWRPRPTRSPWA